MSMEILLTKGKVAIVDDEDFEFLSQWKWHVVGPVSKMYAARHSTKKERQMGEKRSYLYLHRVVANTPSNLDTDHRNGNSLDNRKINLRVCTTSQNLANRSKLSSNRTGYKGTYLDKKTGKFIAQIGWQRKGKRKNFIIGSFNTVKEAALAYEVEAQKRYKEFAKLEILEVRH